MTILYFQPKQVSFFNLQFRTLATNFQLFSVLSLARSKYQLYSKICLKGYLQTKDRHLRR